MPKDSKANNSAERVTSPPLSRPLTARSVLLSVLLGTEPPRLPVSLLVSTTALFGIAEGTTRTALSRMASSGELAAEDGWYAIADPRLLERQARQAASRRGQTRTWDGSWLQLVVVADGRRPAGERAALRDTLQRARLAELREGVWLRPDNLVSSPTFEAEVDDHRHLVRFTVAPEDPHHLVHQLWDLDGWAKVAGDLIEQVTDLTPALDAGDLTALADGFVLSAAVLRHLQADPLLPPDLVDHTWPGPGLRAVYDRYDAAYRAVLRAWFDRFRP